VTITVDGQAVTGTLVDVSVAGLRCTVARAGAVRVGQEGEVRFRLGGSPVEVHGRITVRRVVATGDEIGMELDGVSPQATEIIESHVLGAQAVGVR
jgi:hypothetical protein